MIMIMMIEQSPFPKRVKKQM
uniref:Uncharacterized protein n=1 Tax=Rhizophora mucronata TaxID=61149 RepID=A0A2P2NVL6_RHIMU